MKARKLPSGKYNIQVYDYTDVTGKKHYISVTAPTKSQVEIEAAKIKQEKKDSAVPENMILKNAMQKYIDLKSPVLPPATIREYQRVLDRGVYGPIENKRLAEIKSADLQYFISGLSASGLSAKTVHNRWTFITSTFNMFAPEKKFKVTLPTKTPPVYDLPTEDQVNQLLAATDYEFATIIMLASVGGLRRGEICGLLGSDILRDQDAIMVSRDVVRDKDNNWIMKRLPKTSASIRTVELPHALMERIPKVKKDEQVFKINPSGITNKFGRLRDRYGLKNVHFHTLRHVAATILHTLGVPDQYIQKKLGWKSDQVLKNVYRNTLTDHEKEFNKKANSYFEDKIDF